MPPELWPWLIHRYYRLRNRLRVYIIYGLSLYDGGFIHAADDIRALSSSTESLEKKISIVENFLEGKPFEIERPKL